MEAEFVESVRARIAVLQLTIDHRDDSAELISTPFNPATNGFEEVTRVVKPIRNPEDVSFRRKLNCRQRVHRKRVQWNSELFF